jgi:hypothetical protein
MSEGRVSLRPCPEGVAEAFGWLQAWPVDKIVFEASMAS